MSRHFDSLRQALRAFELVRIWENERAIYGYGMARDRIDRTRAASEYLYRRVRRVNPGA